MAQSNRIVEEAKRLERPCLYLRTNRKDHAPLQGYWGGRGVVPPPGRGLWNHRVSFSCSWLAKHGFAVAGCISVYEREDDDENSFTTVMDRGARLPRTPKDDAVPLYGDEGRSFIPEVGVLAYGDEEFQRWQVELDKKPEKERLAALGNYESTFQKHCPLYQPRSLKDVAAVLGGWHINWHDTRPLWKETPGDEVASYRCGENKLVLWTFRDAEPWVEVWQDRKGKFHAWGLIT